MNRHQLSFLATIVTIFATSLPASAQLTYSDVNLINIGAGLLTNLINPPHRAIEIKAEAEVKKAQIAAAAEIEKEKLRIAADKITPLLAQWGVSRVSCGPGLVFINGIDTNANTICTQPTGTLTAGYYTYNNRNGQLLRTSGSSMSQTTQTSSQTIQTTQTRQSSGRLISNVKTIERGF